MVDRRREASLAGALEESTEVTGYGTERRLAKDSAEQHQDQSYPLLPWFCYLNLVPK